MKILIAVLLIVHGLIVSDQASSAFNPSGGVKNPSWLNWWPVNLGQSWLFNSLGAEQTLIARASGAFWLAVGISLAAAGLSVLGIVVPAAWWQPLAITGAAISLVMLGLYLHPLLAIGIGATIVVLIALLWENSPTLERPGL